MKTLAAVLEQQNVPLALMELEIPPLKRGQVLVEVVYSGICQTQLNEIRGHKGPDPYLPHTLGHEGSGVVLEVGEGVTKVKAGDAVVLPWIKGSGLDAPSTQYTCGSRKVQSGAISTFMQHAIISENRLIPIPASMPLREAALLGCAIPTGSGIVFHEMGVQEGQAVAIFGMGGVGLSALLAAKLRGAAPLIAIDIQEDKLQKAKLLGATHTIHGREQNPLEVILDITQGRGVDFAIECAGVKQVMESAFACLKAPNGLCVLAGNVPKGHKIEIDPFDLIRGKHIRGTWGGASSIDKDVAFYTELFQQQRFPIGELISHEVAIHDLNSFMEAFGSGKVVRGLLKL